MNIRNLSLFSLLLMLFCSVSCSDNDNAFLRVDVKGNLLEVDGKTFTEVLNVSSSSDWSAHDKTNSSWVVVNRSGNQLVLKFEPNMESTVRKTQIELYNAEGINSYLNVSQAPISSGDIVLSKEDDNWIYYYEDYFELEVVAKGEWTLDVDAADNWVDYNINDQETGVGLVSLYFEPNMAKDKREATLTFKANKETKKIRLIQRGKKGFEDATHKFYMHYATFPVLYSAMDLVQHNLPTMLLDRRNTLSREALGSNVKVVSDDEFPQSFIDEIKRIDQEDPDAVFGYYVDDMRSTFAMSIFTQLAIDTSRVKISIHPDGVGTYTALFSQKYGSATTGEKNYKKADREFYNHYLKLLADPNEGKKRTDKRDIEDWDYPHLFAKYNVARYFIQDYDYLITESDYVKSQIPLTNYVVKTPVEILNTLTPQQQEEFYKLVGFDPKPYKELFAESPKPNLVILGTNTSAGNVSAKKQAQNVQKVIDKFGKEYDIFFKAHPADPAYVNYEDEFPGLRLIMPARMPFEVFTWALNDELDAIGGFTTTTFLSMPLDKIKFIFAKDAASTGELFQNIFADRDDIYWIE